MELDIETSVCVVDALIDDYTTLLAQVSDQRTGINPAHLKQTIKALRYDLEILIEQLGGKWPLED